jgi:hypothetical protein
LNRRGDDQTMRSLILALTSVMLLAGIADAQRTRPRPTPTPRRTTTTSKLPPLDVRAARVKVSNQLYNVDQFVIKLVPIAQNIEAMDREIMTKKVKKELIDLNQANKKKVLTAISTLRGALTTLESEFRAKPALSRYLVTVQGITTLATQAEDAAIAGKFVSSVDPLRQVSTKLNNTLAAMPNAEL